jgi:hypothetical protein
MSTSSVTVRPWRVEPRAITDRDYWSLLPRSPRLAPVIQPMLDRAAAADRFPEMPHASDYLAARRFNDRSRLDAIWFSTRVTLSDLALRRAILGIDPDDPDDRLLDWLWAFATQPSWVVSAHLPGRDLPASGTPQLDLAACEMAVTLAELTEVLGPWMDSVSDTLRQSVLTEIERRVVGPFGDGAEAWWSPTGPSTRQVNNWAGVCGGSILAACESLAAQGRPQPAARRRALDALQLFLDRGLTPDGECDEGISYWTYGVGMATLGLSRLSQNELADRFDLDRIARVADYPRRAHLFDDAFYTGNDAPLRAKASPASAPWLGALTNQPWLLQWATRDMATGAVRHLPHLLRVLAVPEEAWASGENAAPAEAQPATLFPDQQAAILRVATPAGEMLATLSGGHNAERHNHNDLGHFMVVLAGRVALPDLGNMRYTADFFGPQRYTYTVASSLGHNCPVIAGREQRAGADAAGRVVLWEPDAGVFTLDLTAAYPPDAGLTRWTRTLRRDDAAGFTVLDDFTAAPGTPIEHALWTLSPPHWTGNAEFAVDGVRVRVSPDPAAHRADFHDPATLRLREFTDQRPHRVAWTFTTGDTGHLHLQTRLRADGT